MRDLAERLAMLPGVRTEQRGEAWVALVDQGQFSLELLFAPVLEWYVTVRDGAGQAVWTDWVDYRGYTSNDDPAALATGMSDDIVSFVRLAMAAEEFEVVTSGKLLKWKCARWKHGGNWHDVWPLE